MSKSNYRHKVTKIIATLDDNFAAVFGDRLEKVSDRVVKAGTTIEEHTAALEEQDNEATDKTEEDSSKEGNK